MQKKRLLCGSTLCGKGKIECEEVQYAGKRNNISYYIKINPSILSKCFLFKVAKGRSFDTAVAAIKRSAKSICFLFFLSLELISIAALTAESS